MKLAHYDDLSECDYFGDSHGRLRAIGWLQEGHPYPRGQPPRAFFEALVALTISPWEPIVLAGRHECPFCVFTGGPTELRVGGVRVAVGAANIFVPARDAVYVAPSLVLHYIDAHEYAPPSEFQDAVTTCPAMRSLEYLKSIRQHGINQLAKR